MKLRKAVERSSFKTVICQGFLSVFLVGLFVTLLPFAAFAADESDEGVTTTPVELQNVYWSTTQYGSTSISSSGSANLGAAFLVGDQQIPLGVMVTPSGSIDAMHAHINHADYTEDEQDIDFATQQQGEVALSGNIYDAIGIGALGTVNENGFETMHGHINEFGASLPYNLDYYVNVPSGEINLGQLTVGGSTAQ